MEDIAADESDIAFIDVPVFPFRRKTLPAKIIHLRKISQENHVHRMKTAHKKKQLQVMQEPSMSMSFAFGSSRRASNSLNSPFSTPTDNACSRISRQKQSSFSQVSHNLSSKMIHSSNRKKDFHSKFTNVNKTEKFSANNSIKSDTSLDLHFEAIPAVHSSDKVGKWEKITEDNDKQVNTPEVHEARKECEKMQSEFIHDARKYDESKTSKSTLNNTPSRNYQQKNDNINDLNTLNSYKMKESENSDDALNKPFKKCQIREGSNAEVETKYFSVSKVPILHSRLSLEKKNKNNRIPVSNTLNNYKMKESENSDDSLNISFKNCHIREGSNAEMETKYSTISKIPILRSRLSLEKKNRNNRILVSNSFRKSIEKSEVDIQNVLRSEISNTDAVGDNITIKTQKKFPEMLKNGKTSDKVIKDPFLPDFECTAEGNAFNHSNGCNTQIKEDKISDTLPSVSRWLNNASDDEGRSKNSSDSPLTITNSPKEIIKCSLENSIAERLRTPEAKLLNTASNLTYNINGSCSGSDESVEYFYDTETGDGKGKHEVNESDEYDDVWEDDSYEDSVLTTTEDRNLEVPVDYTPQKPSDAPDYPKTPYNLRYPRCKKTKCIGCVQKIGGNRSTRKSPKKKIRKKQYSLTPKIKENNKK